MQHVLTVSESSARDIAHDFGVDPRAHRGHPARGRAEVFQHHQDPRVPGRIVAMASADTPMKGIAHAARGLREAAHRARRRAAADQPAEAGRPHRAAHRAPRDQGQRPLRARPQRHRARRLVGSAEIACVPSLYEGFSLPTVEAMACGTPLVVSRAGAIPEVVGTDGLCADLVTPGDVGELFRGPRRPARRPGASYPHGRGRPPARPGAVQLAAVAAATAEAYARGGAAPSRR